MPQVPGMGVQERYGGMKGRSKTNQGGGGGSSVKGSSQLLAQNFDPMQMSDADFNAVKGQATEGPDYVGSGASPEVNAMTREVAGALSVPIEQATGRPFGGDMDYMMLDTFFSTPQGKALYDVWKQDGDPTSLIQQFKQFNDQQNSMPDLPTGD